MPKPMAGVDTRALSAGSIVMGLEVERTGHDGENPIRGGFR